MHVCISISAVCERVILEYGLHVAMITPGVTPPRYRPVCGAVIRGYTHGEPAQRRGARGYIQSTYYPT